MFTVLKAVVLNWVDLNNAGTTVQNIAVPLVNLPRYCGQSESVLAPDLVAGLFSGYRGSA